MKEESNIIVVGSGSMQFDKEYAQWIAELARRRMLCWLVMRYPA